MSSKIVINQVLTLFFILIIGFIARKKAVLTTSLAKGLTDLLLNVTAPLMIITSFQFEYSSEMLASAGKILAFSLFVHTFSLLIGMLIYNQYPENMRKVLLFTTIFSNCGFMGFPLLQSIYGKIGVFYGSIFVVGFNVFLWTIGVMIFTGNRDRATLKKLFLNPSLIAVLLGMTTFILSLKIPGPVYTALEVIGEMTTPLSMMIIGSILAEIKLNEIFPGFAVYYGTLMRLVIIPWLSLLATNLLRFTPMLRGICVLSTATPAATMTAIFAQKYNGDSSFASRIIIISTALSIITLPLFILLVNR
ncbi:MAG TPA: AEC family transporter [Firmicutes bacterium]|jgi:hypothetical protein|nr:AEC family transporter [Bacillota bacterium]